MASEGSGLLDKCFNDFTLIKTFLTTTAFIDIDLHSFRNNDFRRMVAQPVPDGSIC